jgi:hypothetical protein
MRVTHAVNVAREIPAPGPAVWERISHHAETHTWILEARVKLLSPGAQHPNGVGAVREVSFPRRKMWSTIQERVTAFQAPSTFSYAIIGGMPGLRDHLGTLSIEPIDGTKCKLTWHVDFDFSPWHPMGWIAAPFCRTFEGVLDSALAELARQMSSSGVSRTSSGEP